MHCHELASTDAGRTWALVLEEGEAPAHLRKRTVPAYGLALIAPGG